MGENSSLLGILLLHDMKANPRQQRIVSLPLSDESCLTPGWAAWGRQPLLVLVLRAAAAALPGLAGMPGRRQPLAVVGTAVLPFFHVALLDGK